MRFHFVVRFEKEKGNRDLKNEFDALSEFRGGNVI